MKKWIALMMLGLASSAMAVDWVEIGGGDSEFTVYGDTSSRTANRAWFLWDYKKPQRDPGSKKFYKTAKVLVGVSCANNQYRILSITNYSQSGQSVWNSGTLSIYDTPWEYVIPGTVNEVEYNFVCHQDPR